MLGPVETLCILGVNVKSLPALVRQEFSNCSAVLKLHRPRSFFPLKMAVYVVSGFLSTIRFTLDYVRWWRQLHKVYTTWCNIHTIPLEEDIRERIVGTIFECRQLHHTICNVSVPEDLLQACHARQWFKKSTKTTVCFVQSVMCYMGPNIANSMMKLCALKNCSDYLYVNVFV